MSAEPDWLARVEEQMDAGEWAEALRLLEEVPEDDGLRWLSTFELWLELHVVDGCRTALERATAILGERDPEVLRARGRLSLETWDLDDAQAAYATLAPDEWGPRLLLEMALVADARGDHGRAHALLERAHLRAPADHPKPLRLSPDAFRDVVKAAADRLPDELHEVLEEVAVVVDPMPTRAVVGGEHPPDLLGLFVGPPVAERPAGPGGELPPTIFLFQRNLERIAVDREHLEEEIRVTLYHELGHALGFDEEGVDDLGLG